MKVLLIAKYVSGEIAYREDLKIVASIERLPRVVESRSIILDTTVHEDQGFEPMGVLVEALSRMNEPPSAVFVVAHHLSENRGDKNHLAFMAEVRHHVGRRAGTAVILKNSIRQRLVTLGDEIIRGKEDPKAKRDVGYFESLWPHIVDEADQASRDGYAFDQGLDGYDGLTAALVAVLCEPRVTERDRQAFITLSDPRATYDGKYHRDVCQMSTAAMSNHLSAIRTALYEHALDDNEKPRQFCERISSSYLTWLRSLALRAGYA